MNTQRVRDVVHEKSARLRRLRQRRAKGRQQVARYRILERIRRCNVKIANRRRTRLVRNSVKNLTWQVKVQHVKRVLEINDWIAPQVVDHRQSGSMVYGG
jgi:hypothetical protein